MVINSARARLKLELAKVAGRYLPHENHRARPFVLLSKQRSGSTWVMDLLDSHPQIRGYDELFHAGGFGHPRVGRNRDIVCWRTYSAIHRPRNRWAMLRLYFEYLDAEVFCAHPGETTTGFKLMYNQASTELGVVAYLQVHRVPVVHLIRGNYLDAILSEETSAARGVFHVEAGAKLSALQIDLDPCTLVDRLDEREAAVRGAAEFLRRAGMPYHEVLYEDLLADPRALKPVLAFLGVREDVPLKSGLSKINPTDHRQLLRNYDEIKATLAGSRFADMLR